MVVDWVNLRYPVNLRTALVGPLGVDQPAPPTNYDYPLPRGAVYPMELRTALSSLVLTTLVPGPSTPIGKAYFEVAVGANVRYPITLRTSLVGPLGVDVAASPFIPDFPLVRAAEYPASLRTLFNDLIRTTLAPTVTAPFSQTDWPLTRASEFALRLRTAVNGPIVSVNLAPPFLPLDWSLTAPASYSVNLRTQTNNLLQTTLFVTVAPPFAETDWPLVRGAEYPVNMRTGVPPSLVLTLLGPVPAPPFKQTDWPLPPAWLVPVYEGGLRTATVNLLESTLYVPPPPGTGKKLIFLDHRLALQVGGSPIYVFIT